MFSWPTTQLTHGTINWAFVMSTQQIYHRSSFKEHSLLAAISVYDHIALVLALDLISYLGVLTMVLWLCMDSKIAVIPFECKGEACLWWMSVIFQAAVSVLVVRSCEYRVHVRILFVHISFLILFCSIHQVMGLLSIVFLLQGSCNFRKPYLKALFLPWSITYQAHVGVVSPVASL